MRLLIFGMILIGLAAPRVLADAQDGVPPLRDVHVTAVELSRIDTESVEVAVHVGATASVTASIQQLIFDRASIDELRLNLPPVQGPIKLRQNEPLDTPLVLHARVNFRDLESLQPLRRIVDAGGGRFQGIMRSRLGLSVFQKVALMTTSAWVMTTVDQNVPVEFPGGRTARTAGLAALTLAEPVWRAGRALQARADGTIASTARAALRESVLALETRYEVRSRNGEIARLQRLSAAFLVDESTLVAPAEAVEPWLFDPAFAEAAADQEVTVVTSTVEIIVRTDLVEGSAGPLSSRRGGARVVKKLEAKETAVSAKTKRRYDLRFRSSDSNLVLLKVSGWKATGIAPAVSEPASSWRTATVVRLRASGDRIEPEFLLTAVRSKEGRLELRDAVDSDAFGSPIWTDGGVVGMVQAETSGADLRRGLEALGFRTIARRN